MMSVIEMATTLPWGVWIVVGFGLLVLAAAIWDVAHGYSLLPTAEAEEMEDFCPGGVDDYLGGEWE